MRSSTIIVGAIISVLGILLAASTAHGQTTEPISANRPGFNEATGMLRRGQIQVELGGSVDEFSPVSRTWSQPFQLRVGVTDGLELRLNSDGVVRVIDPAAPNAGMSDLVVGAAVRASKGSGLTPATAVVGYLTYPTGTPSTRTAPLTPSVFVPMSWTLGGSTISLMPGFTATETDTTVAWTGALGATAIQEAGPITVFAELAGEALRTRAAGGSIVTAGFGGSIRVGLRNQLDVGVSRGMTSVSPASRFYAGWSHRVRD